MTQPTPGPWTFHGPSSGKGRNDDGGDYAITANINGRDQIIAEVFLHVDKDLTVPAFVHARLIAAAPELLEALKAAEDHLDLCGYGDSWERECSEKLPGLIANAIEKAEGKGEE